MIHDIPSHLSHQSSPGCKEFDENTLPCCFRLSKAESKYEGIWRFEELNTVCQKHNETKRIWQVQILYQRHEQLSQARPNSSPKAAHKHGRNFNIQYMQPTKQLLRGHSGFVQTRFVPRICELKSGCAAEQSRNDDCVDHPDVNDVVTYLLKNTNDVLEPRRNQDEIWSGLANSN